MNPRQPATLRLSGRKRAVHVKRLLSGSLTIGLLFAAASCSSGSTETAPTPVLSYPPIGTATLTSLQQRVVDITNAGAVARGITLDYGCLLSVGAQFSDADAKLIDDANTNAATKPNAEPTLSAKGATLAAAVQHCIVPATTTTIGNAAAAGNAAAVTTTTNG